MNPQDPKDPDLRYGQPTPELLVPQAPGIPTPAPQQPYTTPAWQQAPYPAPLPTVPTIQQPVTPQPDPTAELPVPQAPQPTLDFQPSSGNGYGRSNKRAAIITVIVLVAILGLSILAYTLLTDGKDAKQADQTKDTPTSQPTDTPAAIGFDQVSAVSLVPPSNLDRFQANRDNTSAAMKYLTIDGVCTLELGVSDAPEGKSIQELTASYIKKLEADKQTVTAPANGSALSLKSVQSGDKTYKLDTRTFTAASGTKQTLINYSAATTADNKLVYVIRSCVNENGTVEASTVSSLDKEASTIGVIAK